MKSLRSKLTKCLISVLSATGLLSCDEVSKIIPGGNMVMYGCPNIDLKVSGRVTDIKSQPIEGILVKTDFTSDSVFTTKDGYFTFTKNTMTMDSVRLQFKDIDGEANGGQFQDKTAKFKLEKTGPGSGEWFQGTYEAKNVKVTLDKTVQ